MVRNFLLWFLRGLPLGVANVLPGISGGTIMLLLDYYYQVVYAIKHLQFPKLIPFGLGVMMSILLSARLVVWLLGTFPHSVQGILLGLICASVWVVFKQIGRDRRGLLWVVFIGGFTFVVVLSVLSGSAVDLSEHKFVGLFLAGGFASTAMLLPGISGATVLVVLGMYELALTAVVNLQLSILLPLGLGAVGGLLTLAWIMSYLLTYYPRVTLALLAGMISGSIPMLVVENWHFLSLFWALLGFAGVVWLEQRFTRGMKINDGPSPRSPI